jgi:iron complex outermembrane receptor protein
MGPWNLRVGTSYLNLEGYRAHSQTDNRQLNMTLRQDAGGGRVVTAVLQVIDYPMQQDPGGLTAQEVEADPRQARDRNVAYDAGEEVWQEKAGISVQLPVAMNQVLELQGYSVHRDFANRLPFMDGGQVDLERMFFGGGIRYRYSSPMFRAVAGVEGGKQVDDRRNFDNVLGDRGALVLDQEEKVSNLGAYVAGEIGLSREVTLHPALRLDTVRFVVEDFLEEDGDGSGDRTFQAVSPALGICWQPSAPVAFYGNLTTSFETPTTTELNRPEGGGFDPDLEAETAQGVEWGFKGDLADYPGRPVVDLAVFHIEVDDALVPYVPEGSSGREFYRNAGSARKRGLEVSVRFWPREALAVDLSYTFSDFKYRSFETPDGDFGGNRLPGIPEHFGNLRLDYPTKGGHRLIWNTRVVGAMEAEDSNDTRVDAYHFSDLRAEWEREVGRWDLGIVGGIHNVFNARYAANIRINAPGGRFYEPAPERNLYLGFRVRVEL